MTKTLMVQGTASSVGKSILTAALCRILNNRGYKVSPFKSQNMALNSYITRDGFEMGRAQVVQAEAARVEPTVEMNPILLKPTNDCGSQVILMGKVYGNLEASNYFELKNSFKPVIMDAFNKLSEKSDIIVIEGAGSPAEINLKTDDIVNMGMAEMVDAPVILVADIDRGGVFASLYGTYMLLEEKEQKRIKGFIINKFRGDVKLLEPGVKMIEELIPIPCLGVIPYIKHNIDDEDSVTDKFLQKTEKDIKIGIVKLPYISNFTDFNVFDLEKNISVSYITDKDLLEEYDLVILPGSKNTLHDMLYIHNSGLKEKIYRYYKNGGHLFGICGGYQMLGSTIQDSYEVESKLDTINGLGLLEVDTVMEKEKTTTNVKGLLSKDIFGKEIEISGYEIHMGVTTSKKELNGFAVLEDGRTDGIVSENGRIMGTYLHGIFDNDEFRRLYFESLAKDLEKNIEIESINYKELKEMEYDKLAMHVEKYVDMEKILSILEGENE